MHLTLGIVGTGSVVIKVVITVVLTLGIVVFTFGIVVIMVVGTLGIVVLH